MILASSVLKARSFPMTCSKGPRPLPGALSPSQNHLSPSRRALGDKVQTLRENVQVPLPYGDRSDIHAEYRVFEPPDS